MRSAEWLQPGPKQSGLWQLIVGRLEICHYVAPVRSISSAETPVKSSLKSLYSEVLYKSYNFDIPKGSINLCMNIARNLLSIRILIFHFSFHVKTSHVTRLQHQQVIMRIVIVSSNWSSRKAIVSSYQSSLFWSWIFTVFSQLYLSCLSAISCLSAFSQVSLRCLSGVSQVSPRCLSGVSQQHASFS